VAGRLVMLVWQPLRQNHWVRDFTVALAAGRNLRAPPSDAPSRLSVRGVIVSARRRDDDGR
jgi:hypothetical protein